MLFPTAITEELLSKCRLKKHIFGSATLYYHPLIELDAHFCLKRVPSIERIGTHACGYNLNSIGEIEPEE